MLGRLVVYVAVALAVGVLLGRLRGGRVAHVAEADVRWPLVFAAGIAAQLASIAVDGDAGVVLLVASFVLIGVFTARNLTRPGMGVVLVGVAANALVVGVNAGMPVRESAIVRSGLAERDEIDELDFNAKWHLETADDDLTFLGDIIPVPGAREVLSFGDLILAVGAADVVVHLMRPRGVRRRGPEASASTSTG